MLCLDLDDFKLVNDSLGHPAGDVVLRVVGERLSGLLRPGDAVARLGGDEFAMLVSGHDPAAGGAVAQRALAAIRQPIALPGGRTVHSNVSVGVAHSNGDSSVEALLRDADIAMYLAKQSGKGHHEVFQPGMRQDMIDRLEMRVELAEALARNEFVLHYQPIVEVATGRPVGRRGAAALGASPSRTSRADAVHPVGGRDRVDHPDRSLGVDGGMPSRRRTRPAAVTDWRSP